MKSKYAKEYGVKLYNQGFLKFGPMEQCDTGEWVRWADIAPFLEATELGVRIAKESDEAWAAKYYQAKNDSIDWKERYFLEKGFNDEIRKWNRFWVGATCLATIVSALQGWYILLGGI